MPSECYAACWGYTDYVLVDCDSIYNDDWDWDDDWNDDWDDGCNCDESDLEGEGICIEVTLPDTLFTGTELDSLFGETLTYQTWVPSECYAQCWGYTDYVIIDCDSINIGGIDGLDLGGIDFDSLEIFWDDCDCMFFEDDEPVCVLTDTELGIICPFPNMCYAECAGYTEDDVVDCEESIDFGCAECIDEEIDPVCVIDSTGNVFPVPNQCFADCLGFMVVEEGCGDMVNGSDIATELITPEIVKLQSDNIGGVVTGYKLYPNPTVDQISLTLDLTDGTDVTISITNYNGQVVKSQFTSLNSGLNNLQFEVNDLTAGLYTISVYNDQRLLSQRFIKQ